MFDCVIVNYNTPILTNACVRSLMNSGTDCNIFVFDNSDNEKIYNPIDSSVNVFDNTKGQIFDFETFLRQFPTVNDDNIDFFRSAKHSKTIDILFNMFPNGFLHIDSDVIVKKNLNELYDTRFIASGQYIQPKEDTPWLHPRIHPCLMYINVPMCNEYGIKFFDPERNFGLTSESIVMDTGCSFYQDIKKNNLPIKEIDNDEYINHLNGGSGRRNETQYQYDFINNNLQYLI